MNKQRALFICTHNSARSQMAEGLLRHYADDRFEVFSAGIDAAAIRPEAIEVMAEIGIDISGQTAKALDPFLAQPFDWVITVCDQARQACPVFRGRADRSLGFGDPAEAVRLMRAAGRLPPRAAGDLLDGCSSSCSSQTGATSRPREGHARMTGSDQPPYLIRHPHRANRRPPALATPRHPSALPSRYAPCFRLPSGLRSSGRPPPRPGNAVRPRRGRRVRDRPYRQ